MKYDKNNLFRAEAANAGKGHEPRKGMNHKNFRGNNDFWGNTTFYRNRPDLLEDEQEMEQVSKRNRHGRIN